MSGKTVEHELSFYTTIVKWQGNGFVFEEKTVLRSLRTISAAGIRWIGIDGINIIEPCNSDLKKIVPLVRGWLDDLGLRVSSFHYASPTFASPDNGQEHVRDTMRRSLELFSAWQPRSFVVHAGWMETGGDNSAVAIESLFRDTVRKHGRETVRNALVENIKYWGREAAEYNIRLALETMGNLVIFGDEKELPELVADIDMPTVGYCIDSGHSHIGGESVADWIRKAGTLLFETHFHDNRGKRDEHLPVGFGTINWLEVINALSEINFEGPVTFETSGWPGDDMVTGYRQAVAWWRAAERLANIIDKR